MKFVVHILLTTFLLMSVYPIPQVGAGGVMSTPAGASEEGHEETRLPGKENTPPPDEIPLARGHAIPEEGHEYAISHENRVDSVPHDVKERISKWPTYDAMTRDGLFKKSGSFAYRCGGKLYIYMCFTLTELGCTMQVTHCTIKRPTLFIHSQPIPRGGEQGSALHNVTKLISVDDPHHKVKQYTLATYPWYGYMRVIAR